MNKFFLIVLLAFAMAGCQSYKKSPICRMQRPYRMEFRTNSCMMRR